MIVEWFRGLRAQRDGHGNGTGSPWDLVLVEEDMASASGTAFASLGHGPGKRQ